MPKSTKKKFSLGTLRTLFLSCFGALLVLEICLSCIALRYNIVQNAILADQALLLRVREILNDALRDAIEIGKTISGLDDATKNPNVYTPPASAQKAMEALALLRKISRSALLFPSEDIDRLDDLVSNNAKLLAVSPAYSADQKLLREKTDKGFSAFLAAIDIRLFSSMQELRRETEFLQMIMWGLLPLLVLSTVLLGLILYSKVMEPLLHLKKQARKLTEDLTSLQRELRKTQEIPQELNPSPQPSDSNADTIAPPAEDKTLTPQF
jgi:hypothetical protein